MELSGLCRNSEFLHKPLSFVSAMLKRRKNDGLLVLPAGHA
ncbi:hypothetical protein HMPREF0742_01023 [Rothia aeria F0184]|uniref:Uncharacterized protein n=1 Tax=Rothia aeria F0184 TaxID=888019 RepID=U7V494_9MICC|nr:hypothetical protein HMPREF0742_01023 [Rothia aeria F0184]